MDGRAWYAAVHGVAKSQTQLSDFTFTFHFHVLEKEMATHSSVLAWRIPGTGQLVGYHLWGHTESDTTSDLAEAAAAAATPKLYSGGSAVKNPHANAGDVDLIHESGRSPGEGNGYSLRYSCLGNPVDREA